MITITIDEAVNGYMVTIFDWKDSKRHREVCEREIDAWDIVRRYSERQVEKGLQRIRNASLDVEV